MARLRMNCGASAARGPKGPGRRDLIMDGYGTVILGVSACKSRYFN